jgi:multidrug resistance protein, MATE family
VPLGLGQAATVRVGLALGRRDEAAIARAGWTAWVIGVGFMGTMALVMWSIPRELITLFLKDVPANAVVIALAVSFLRVAAAFQLVDGAQVIGAGMLRGLHDSRCCSRCSATGLSAWASGPGWHSAATGKASASG